MIQVRRERRSLSDIVDAAKGPSCPTRGMPSWQAHQDGRARLACRSAVRSPGSNAGRLSAQVFK